MRPIQRRFVGFLVILLAFSSGVPRSSAQTTQSVANWVENARQFAQKLAQQDRPGVAAMLSRQCAVHAFDGGSNDDLTALLAAVNGQMIGVHAYVQPPLSMAADLAADFKNAKALPGALRTHMIPQDERAMQRANAIAAQWVEEVLGAKEGEPVAVAVFHVPQTAALSASPVIFVLLKGDNSGRITMVIFGQPS